jgi:preprotein translocase subunit SecA
VPPESQYPTEKLPILNGAPPALRARGIDDSGPRGLSYSGPDEGGRTAVHSDAEEYGGSDAPTQGTRRERREAARAQTKQGRGPKTRRKH